MKKSNIFLPILGILLLSISCKNTQQLFQEHKDDWIEHGNASWGIRTNELVGTVKNGAGFVTTKEHYNDFILELEFKPDSTINSGVFVRCDKNPISAVNCFEINIWDSNPNQDYRTGSIVGKFIPLAKIETIGKWNTYKIKCKKNQIRFWVNGILTAEMKDESNLGGYIGLQAQDTGEIKFRNIKIKKLK